MNLNHLIGVRSDFSIGESMIQIDRLADRAAELGYESVAIADIMTVSSMVDFSKKMKEKGIKPVIGCTLRVYDDPTYRRPSKSSGEKPKPNPMFMPKVFIKNENGLKTLFKLLSKGHSEEYFYYHARVGLDELLALEDVVVTTGDLFGLFYHPRHEEILDELLGKFGDDLYAELVPINTPLFDTLNRKLVDFTSKRPWPVNVIASYPALYLEDDNADTLDVYRAITSNAKIGSPTLPIPYMRDLYLKEPAELLRRVGELKKREYPTTDMPLLAQAVKNIEAIQAKCDYEFKKLEPCLPKMADDEFATLARNVKDGWNARFSREVLGHKPTPEEMPVYKDRLIYELSVLKKMGFSSYFLLVQDIVNWSKDNGIIVGPGRGSVGGSLIAYLLGITEVDPIRFKLLFERFINPERIDLPDADLDFQSTRRHEVIEYIVNKYGQDRVAGVSNYGTLASASALRDAGRVHELDNFALSCTKLVPKEHGQSVDLETAAQMVPEIEKFKSEHSDLWKHATSLEGAMRSLGQHAAGIVVAGEPLTERSVVETRSGGAVVNWDKRVVEDWGLIKMDILGLSTLDVLELAAKYIRERHGKTIDFTRLPLDEADVMDAFGKGDTTGIFQFESPGMKKLLKDLASAGRLTFEDLAATTALYRPGPMDSGMLDDYVAVHQGIRKAHYDHPTMESSLAEYNGVMIYQESVMQVARDLAGFTMAEADALRKVMGKKDKDGMAKMRDKWVKGCADTNGVDEELANYIFDKIEKFAAYGFNRSHSVEYSIISYQAMWVKVRYPAEFYAAAMTVVDDDEKLTGLVMDARKRDIEVLPPDINISTSRIEIDGDHKLYAPLQAVKGISTNVASHVMTVQKACREGITVEGVVVREPQDGFKSLADFEDYVSLLKLASKVNKSHREKLVRVGAFASIEKGLPARHPDRLKDQLELMPGFTTDSVKADRGIPTDELIKIKIVQMMSECKTCTKCSLSGGVHVTPRMGKAPKFMVVFDAPSNAEERKGKMLEGNAAEMLKTVMEYCDLTANDGYFTSLVKSPKNDKMLSNEQINGCSAYLMREIEILRPPVIVTLGSAATRFFAPGVKGSPAELAGKAVFRPDLDASVVFGINPAQILFDPSKAKLLEATMRQVVEIIS
jgi:DNA polymerase-3 subunit alpha